MRVLCSPSFSVLKKFIPVGDDNGKKGIAGHCKKAASNKNLNA